MPFAFPAGARPGRRAALLALAVLGCLALAAPATAAGDTGVAVSPEPTTVERGANATVDVVVTDAAGGVGAYNLTVSVGNASVARIAAVEPGGDPGLTDASVAPDGSTATVQAALANTSDEGRVPIASVTLTGANAGTISLSVSIHTLGDEQGTAYDVTAVPDGRVTVPDGNSAAADATTDPADAPAPSTDGERSGDSVPVSLLGFGAVVVLALVVALLRVRTP
jgi:hypothetical protein